MIVSKRVFIYDSRMIHGLWKDLYSHFLVFRKGRFSNVRSLSFVFYSHKLSFTISYKSSIMNEQCLLSFWFISSYSLTHNPTMLIFTPTLFHPKLEKLLLYKFVFMMIRVYWLHWFMVKPKDAYLTPTIYLPQSNNNDNRFPYSFDLNDLLRIELYKNVDIR